MIGYVQIVEQCDCGSYDWKYEYIESGSRKTCRKCGTVVETIWETAVTDNDGGYYFLSDMEKLDQDG